MGLTEWLKAQRGGMLVGTAIGAVGTLATQYGIKTAQRKLQEYGAGLRKTIIEEERKANEEVYRALDKRLEGIEKALYDAKKDQ